MLAGHGGISVRVVSSTLPADLPDALDGGLRVTTSPARSGRAYSNRCSPCTTMA